MKIEVYYRLSVGSMESTHIEVPDGTTLEDIQRAMERAYGPGLVLGVTYCRTKGHQLYGVHTGDSKIHKTNKFSKWFGVVLVLCIPASIFIGFLIIIIATGLDKLGLMTPQIEAIINASGPTIVAILAIIFGIDVFRGAISFFKGEW